MSIIIESLQIACEYDPEREGSVDDLIGYKDALEDRLSRAEDRLIEEIRNAERAVDADTDYWTELATGQDTEEAEASGTLEGTASGLRTALKILRGEE